MTFLAAPRNNAKRSRMVRFDNVWLKYRRAAADAVDVLQALSFEVPDGGFRWLTGPSGAGKTSVLKLMYMAEHPYRGRIDILGTNPAATNRRDAALLRRRIGVVYQDFRLLPHLTVYDNVALPMRLARRNEAQIHADVMELLRWVGLFEKRQVLPDELSGGEQQRIAIARAVVGRPKLLLADEPTGNLDDNQAERLMLLITALNKLGTTIVVATHNAGLMARYPAPRLQIEEGRLRA
jgi:cell division transport system ATP-binding protein